MDFGKGVGVRGDASFGQNSTLLMDRTVCPVHLSSEGPVFCFVVCLCYINISKKN